MPSQPPPHSPSPPLLSHTKPFLNVTARALFLALPGPFENVLLDGCVDDCKSFESLADAEAHCNSITLSVRPAPPHSPPLGRDAACLRRRRLDCAAPPLPPKLQHLPVHTPILFGGHVCVYVPLTLTRWNACSCGGITKTAYGDAEAVSLGVGLYEVRAGPGIETASGDNTWIKQVRSQHAPRHHDTTPAPSIGCAQEPRLGELAHWRSFLCQVASSDEACCVCVWPGGLHGRKGRRGAGDWGPGQHGEAGQADARASRGRGGGAL